jgi:hypothetical protein
MKDQEKYNGWSNYPTWRVALEVFDELPLGFERVTSRECIDYAVEVVSDGADGFALDYALAFLNTVNWQEIADHVNEWQEVADHVNGE